MSEKAPTILRPPAEILYREELAALAAADKDRRPPGWLLSPKAVRTFILGSGDRPVGNVVISKKFYGDDQLVERSIVTLLGNRGLILVGEPGTAKSMLSELLAAAISGVSTNTIQGTAGTTEDAIKYSWNYALLLAEGPSPAALVPSPVYTGLKRGLIVRFEEITRCQPEIQDALVSILSDKVMLIPELRGEEGVVYAEKGFNILATANLRDRGVHDMSSALKRRFNFETILPIREKALEIRLVTEQTERLLAESEVSLSVPTEVMELLVTTFQDLRNGRTEEGLTLEKPSAVMSTAEAVAVGLSAGLDAYYFGNARMEGAHVARQLVGSVLKDNPDDAKKLKHYHEAVVKVRARRSGVWKSYFDAARKLEG
jgi:MoxR-like ATPase